MTISVHRRAALPGDDDDPALAPLRVLIGEADVSCSELLTKILRGRGYEVATVCTQEAILEQIDTIDFDVLLLAWSLPGASGLSVLRQVRARFALPDLPVVLMSTSADSANVVQAFDRGANDFIRKPLDPDVTLVRVHNLVALRRARLALRQQAMVDELTGVFNRRYMMEQLRSQLSQAQRYGRKLSFCLCDIDHFKLVNDTHGHRAGDHALEIFARMLRGRLRSADIVGRFGGDEFCVILPETSVSEARIAIEGVRGCIQEAEIPVPDGSTCRITGSFGIAEIGPGTADVNALVSKADEALYRAKAQGRNCTCAGAKREPTVSRISMRAAAAISA